jgi:hypothetical protein
VTITRLPLRSMCMFVSSCNRYRSYAAAGSVPVLSPLPGYMRSMMVAVPMPPAQQIACRP